MAKKIVDDSKTVVLDVIETTNQPLDKIAFSIVRTSEKLYAVYSVEFNTNGNVGSPKVVVGDLDLFECQYQFKLAVTDAGLFNELDKV